MSPIRHLLAIVVLLPGAAAAQLSPSNPIAPGLHAPAAGATLQGQAPGLTQLTLQWNHSGLFGHLQQPLPTHFVVCLKAATQTTNCSFSAGDFLPAGSIASTYLYNGFLIVGYRYTLPMHQAGLTISDSLLDIDLTWSVGACRGTAANLCTFSPTRSLFLAARDLQARNVSSVHRSTHAVYRHRFRNAGTTSIPALPFKVSVVEWEALLNSRQQCRVDLDTADVRNDRSVIVFMDNGDGRWMVDLPLVNGRRVAPGTVVGMHRWNGGSNLSSAQLDFGLALGAGQQGEVEHAFALPNALRPRGFINVTFVDTTARVREFNELNNGHAECDVVPLDG